MKQDASRENISLNAKQNYLNLEKTTVESIEKPVAILDTTTNDVKPIKIMKAEEQKIGIRRAGTVVNMKLKSQSKHIITEEKIKSITMLKEIIKELRKKYLAEKV